MVATVTQFNAVSYRVISSILIEPKLRAQVRQTHRWLALRSILTNSLRCSFLFAGSRDNYRNMDRYCARAANTQELFIAKGDRIGTAIECDLSIDEDVAGAAEGEGKNTKGKNRLNAESKISSYLLSCSWKSSPNWLEYFRKRTMRGPNASCWCARERPNLPTPPAKMIVICRKCCRNR